MRDGWPHVTPIWYVWEDGRFLLSLGKSRRHLRNIAGDPHVTLCVDEDPRTTDLTKSPRAVVCFGMATLVEDEAGVRDATTKMESRYLPSDHGGRVRRAALFEGRVGVEITPSMAGRDRAREAAVESQVTSRMMTFNRMKAATSEPQRAKPACRARRRLTACVDRDRRLLRAASSTSTAVRAITRRRSCGTFGRGTGRA